MSDEDNLRRRIGQLKLELEKARNTNRALHRRVQSLEGPVQSEIARLKWMAEYRRTQNQHDFSRLMQWGACIRECYLAAAEALGLPGKPLHSVMERVEREPRPPADNIAKHSPKRVHANCFVPGGIESYDVADTVRLLADRFKAFSSDPAA